jgi:threonine synthase
LAAYLAKQMGVPIRNFICASNENKVLYDFFRTGTYDRNREFILTASPSMDILISSNLERLIYLSADCDARVNTAFMKELEDQGSYTVTAGMRRFMEDFKGGFAGEKETGNTIKKVFEETGYLMDPHTGVAAYVYGEYQAQTKDLTKNLIVSTASPYKFAASVLQAIDGLQGEPDEFYVIEHLSELSGIPAPKAVEEIRAAPVRHHTECGADGMKAAVKGFLD